MTRPRHPLALPDGGGATSRLEFASPSLRAGPWEIPAMTIALRHLTLIRPLAFVDLETTGLEPRDDRIVELGVLVLTPDAGPTRYLRRLDPGISIPEAARAVHGIGEEDVAGCPRFGEIARDLADLLADADLAGFNLRRFNLRRFDLPMLAAEFARAGVEFALAGRAVLDAQRIFHARERRDLAAAVQFYCGREHRGPHGALADATAAAAVLDAQLGRYSDLPRTAEALHRSMTNVDIGERFRSEGGRATFAFGKHRGRALEEVARTDPGYLRWFLDQDFLDDAKALVAEAMDRACRRPR